MPDKTNYYQLEGGEVEMNAKSIKRGLVSLAVTFNMACLSALTVFADNEQASKSNFSAAQEGVSSTFGKVIKFVAPIAYSLVALVIVIMGIVLIWGGDKAKEKVKSHVALIIIGCVLVAGGTAIAQWLTGSIKSGF